MTRAEFAVALSAPARCGHAGYLSWVVDDAFSVCECIHCEATWAHEAAVLVGGAVLYNVHDPAQCAGRPCAVHNPSAHHMRDWPQRWRGDRQMIERLCPCGIGHPDPDDLNADGIHGCCGHCRPEGNVP